LHVEPHGKKERLQPGDEHEPEEQVGSRGHKPLCVVNKECPKKKQQAQRNRYERQGIEEDQGMKILDNILNEETLEKSSEEQAAYYRNYLPEADAGLFSHIVNRLYGNIHHSAIFNVEFNKDIIRHPVAFVNRV
jgi:hypothetical protein